MDAPHYVHLSEDLCHDDLTAISDVVPPSRKFHFSITGPEGCPYYERSLKMILRFPKEYPEKPPVLTVKSNLFHPNIGPDGTVHMDLFYDEWIRPVNGSIRALLNTILESLRSLLVDPVLGRHVRNYRAAILFGRDKTRYHRKVRRIMDAHEQKESLEEKQWLGFVLNVFGIIFILADIGTDIKLVSDYHYDYKYFKASRSEDRPGECASPKQDMGKYSSIFMILTVIWLVLGCICQTGIAAVLAYRKSKPFDELPLLVKILTFFACPLMMGPLAVMFYLAVRCVRKIGEDELVEYKVLVGTLKMGEILFESIPQLLLNAVSIILRCSSLGPGKFFANISIWKWLSIVTSVFAITFTVSDWLYKEHKRFFITKTRHPWASMIGIFLWVLLGVCLCFSGTTSVEVIYKTIKGNHGFVGTGGIYIGLILGFSGGLLVLFVFIISSACTGATCCKEFKGTYSVLYIIVLAALIVALGCVHQMCKDSWSPLSVTLALLTIHLVVSVLILPSPKVGATVFNPMVKLMFCVLNRVPIEWVKKKAVEWEVWERWDCHCFDVVDDENNDNCCCCRWSCVCGCDQSDEDDEIQIDGRFEGDEISWATRYH